MPFLYHGNFLHLTTFSYPHKSAQIIVTKCLFILFLLIETIQNYIFSGIFRTEKDLSLSQQAI